MIVEPQPSSDQPAHPSTQPSLLHAASPLELADESDADGEGAPSHDRALTAERRLLCMIVRQLTEELLRATGLESSEDPGRRATSHVRQVAMYVCHIAYSMPMGEVAQAFGRDRSTVGHACRMVEDRRDDRAYDTFVGIVERMASAVHLLAGRRI
jgi:hypothetical protein